MTSQQNFRVASFVAGLFGKAPVKVATTANITLSGEQTVNSVALLEGDRCLVKDQTNPVENGIYTVEQSAWQRAGDFDGQRDITQGTMITVLLSTGAIEIYAVTSAGTNIGVDSLTIEQFLVTNSAAVPEPTLQEVSDSGAVTTNALQLLNLVMPEAAIPTGPGTGFGRIWVKTGNPNELWWTNEAGTHVQLGTGGTGGLNNVLEDATPELGGPLGCLDEEVQRANLVDYAVKSTSPTITTGAITFDCAVSNAFQVTLTENITAITLSNPPASGRHGEMTIKFVQDGTGSRTVAWPASVKWPGGTAPVITTTLTTGTDLIHLETWDSGTTWFGTFVQDMS